MSRAWPAAAPNTRTSVVGHRSRSGPPAAAGEARLSNGKHDNRRSSPPAKRNQVASVSELQAQHDAALAEHRRKYNAATSTIEALMFCLRERGVPGLASADTQRRLSELSDEQVRQVIVRLDRMRDRYPQVTDELLVLLGEKIRDA